MRHIAITVSLATFSAALAAQPLVPSSSPTSPTLSSVQVASATDVDSLIAGNMLGNPAEFRNFFDQLKKAVAAHDKQALAKMMNYPLRVSNQGIKVVTEKDFVAHYDKIFTPPVVAAVAGQSYADLFVRDQGVSVGNGEIWFTGICTNKSCSRRIPKVITVNTP